MTEPATTTPPPASVTPPPSSAEEKWKPKVPPSVAAAAARADELHKAVYTPEPEDKPAEGTQEKQGEPPAAEAKQPAPASQEPPKAPPAPSQKDWERDYNAMKGRWERAEENNKALVDRLEGLENLVRTLKVQGKVPPKEEDKPARQRLVTEEDEKDFGPDFLQVVAKKARDELVPDIEEMRSTINYLKEGLGAVGQNMAQTSTEKVYQALSQTVPNWRELNDDDGFKEWLSNVDPYAGKKRWDLLTEAFNRHDAPRVVNFFRGFLSEAAVTDPQRAPRASASPASNGAAQGKVPLASFAAPGRAGPAAPSGPADKPFYTRAQIAQFYLDKSRGKWQGRDAEAAVIDADIIAAGNEGRIR